MSVFKIMTSFTESLCLQNYRIPEVLFILQLFIIKPTDDWRTNKPVYLCKNAEFLLMFQIPVLLLQSWQHEGVTTRMSLSHREEPRIFAFLIKSCRRSKVRHHVSKCPRADVALHNSCIPKTNILLFYFKNKLTRPRSVL